MALKILSFLGTTRYQKCTYSFPGEIKIHDEKFFQLALTKYFIQTRKDVEDIKTIVFCTEQAIKDNLKCKKRKELGKNNEETDYLGLEHEVKGYGKEIENSFIFKKNVKDNEGNLISIPTGSNEEDIWILLKMIFDEIEEDDEIVFDITHGFRSLPMIAIVILNYAKYVKNIKISGIYYGAFEARKNIFDKDNNFLYMDAPAYDMSSFNLMIEWIIGMEKYLSSGESNKLKELVIETKSRVSGENVTNSEIQQIESWIQSLNNFSKAVGLSDSFDITFLGNKIREEVRQAKVIASKMIPALDMAMEKIEDRFDNYRESDIVHNVHETTIWCCENNMIQQAYTLFRENIITYVYEKLQLENSKHYLNIEKYNTSKKLAKDIIREYVSTALNRCALQLNFHNKRQKVKKRDMKLLKLDEEFVKRTFKYNQQQYDIYTELWTSKIDNEIIYIFSELRKRRNYINHAGYCKVTKKEKDNFIKDLRGYVSEFSKIINDDLKW